MSILRHIPNTITSMNLLCGVMGVIFALWGNLQGAFPLMIAGAVFDFCDGLAARLLKAYSPIGKELDSLADLVTFGLLPSVMLFQTVFYGGYLEWPAYICLVLAVFSALRLAKFNVDARQESDFLGLATPASAMICGSLTYFTAEHPQSDLGVLVRESAAFLPVLAVILSLLLVSEIPMFGMKIGKGKKLLDAKRTVFLFLAAASILAVILLGLNWSLAVFLIFSLYVAENIILWLFFRKHAENK